MTHRSSSDPGYVIGGLSNFPAQIDGDSIPSSSNDAKTTLVDAITWSSTQVRVSDGSRFPASNGVLRVGGEMIFYGRRRGNVCDQLSRGHGSSFPANHQGGSEVTAPCVADMNNAVRDAIVNLQAKVGLKDDLPSIAPGATLRSRIAFLRQKWFTPQAGFKAMVRTGYAPMGVQFRDFSIGEPIRWIWEFGDGTTSSEQHPYHEYLRPGEYDVGLTIFTSADVSVQNGVSAKIKHGYVVVLDNDVINDVIFYVRNITGGGSGLSLQGVKPLTMRFTDQTRGAVTTRIWNFGDGVSQSVNDPSQYEVEHTYVRSGVFNPTLTVSDGTKVIRKGLGADVKIVVN